jgi:hypothetical protein
MKDLWYELSRRRGAKAETASRTRAMRGPRSPRRAGRRISPVVLCMAIAAVIMLPAVAQAEPLSNAGKEFWLGFPSNIEQNAQSLTLYISGTSATTGTVTIPGLGFSEPFTVIPGTVTKVRLPDTAEIDPGASNVTENKGIHVTAEQPVTVYGLNDFPFTTDAYTGLPTDVIGDSYTVLAFGAGLGGNSEFAVVASQNHTTVTITPSVTAGPLGELPAGVPFKVSLEAGEEYQLQAFVNPEDLTGTKVTSSAPVSVFGGQQCANVPSNAYFACDTMVEQDFPEATWGSSFLTEPLKTRSNGDDFEMAADASGTEISLNGSHLVTLNAGEHYAQEIEGASEITSSKPIELAQYSNSSSYDGTTGDPFMINIPPYDQFETGYTITTPVESETVFTNYLNLVVPDSEVGLVKLDGTAISAGEYNTIGTSGFEGVQVDISPGSHVLTGNGQPFGAFVYGFSEYNGYGYAGGFSLAPVAEVTKVTLMPANETAVVNTSHCVTAAVTDQEGEPLPGVRVDFIVTGANSAKESVFANNEGKAQFCYTGTKPGVDTITGSVGLVKGTAAKTWEEEAVVESGPQLDGIASAQQQNEATAKLTTKGAGDLIVAFVAADSPFTQGQVSTVSGGGLTWALVARENKALGGAEVWVARATGVLTGDQITAKVTKTTPGSPAGHSYDETITVAAFKNSSGLGAVGTFNSKKGAASGTITTTKPNSWVWAVGDDWLSSISRTVPAGQTLWHQATDAVGDTYWIQSTGGLTKAAGTSVTVNDPSPTIDPFDMVLVEIL